jgi:hypothetical protein
MEVSFHGAKSSGGLAKVSPLETLHFSRARKLA